MHLYFVRHGESEANLNRQFSNLNHEIHPLTDRGRAQAQALAEKLRDVKFTEIYSSPMLRARQTAEILNEPHGLQVQVTPALIEHNAGDLEGRADKEAWDAYSRLFETWLRAGDFDARMPNGESYNEMRVRFVPFVANLVAKYQATDANILMVAHAGILHSMLPLVLSNVTYEFGYHHILENAALVLAEQRDGALVCRAWSGIEMS